MAEPAATEREQKNKWLEDLPGENDQMLAEATAAHDEGVQGGGGAALHVTHNKGEGGE